MDSGRAHRGSAVGGLPRGRGEGDGVTALITGASSSHQDKVKAETQAPGPARASGPPGALGRAGGSAGPSQASSAPGSSSSASPPDASPGPVYFLDPKVTRFGRSCTPAYSIQGRGRTRGECPPCAAARGPALAGSRRRSRLCPLLPSYPHVLGTMHPKTSEVGPAPRGTVNERSVLGDGDAVLAWCGAAGRAPTSASGDSRAFGGGAEVRGPFPGGEPSPPPTAPDSVTGFQSPVHPPSTFSPTTHLLVLSLTCPSVCPVAPLRAHNIPACPLPVRPSTR